MSLSGELLGYTRLAGRYNLYYEPAPRWAWHLTTEGRAGMLPKYVGQHLEGLWILRIINEIAYGRER